MAEMSVSGFDALAANLKDLGLLGDGELVEEMLGAGAEIVAEEWKKGINQTVKKSPKRSTGEMAASVAPSKGIDKTADCSAKTIYPQGKDHKGIRNAEKAYILHYGKSGQAGTHFVDAVEDAAEDKAADAMADIFDGYLERKGLI